MPYLPIDISSLKAVGIHEYHQGFDEDCAVRSSGNHVAESRASRSVGIVEGPL